MLLPLGPPVALRRLNETVRDLSSRSCGRIAGSGGQCPTARWWSSGLKGQVTRKNPKEIKPLQVLAGSFQLELKEEDGEKAFGKA